MTNLEFPFPSARFLAQRHPNVRISTKKFEKIEILGCKTGFQLGLIKGKKLITNTAPVSLELVISPHLDL